MNCYDLCYRKHLQSLSVLRNISLIEANQCEINFDRQRNCDSLCPLECDSIYFETSNLEHLLSQEDFEYYSAFLDKSKIYKKENMLLVKIRYEELKYTHMSQTAKMTFTDLVSNVGGVLGVFLELSFYSAYRLVHFTLGKFVELWSNINYRIHLY